MSGFDRKKHWEKIYQTKNIDEVSWYQPVPATSLDFVKQYGLPLTAKIIDIGGGDSFFVDHLIDMGYKDITVLDISEKAVEKAKQRLGEKGDGVIWIIADAANFTSSEKFDLWHDRAALHFLTDEKEIQGYIYTLNTSVNPKGYVIIGTFSENGPKQCSGIDIKQYSENTLADRLRQFFGKIKCVTIDHKTPSGSIQNFIFCSFRRIETA